MKTRSRIADLGYLIATMLRPGSTYSEEFPAVADSVPRARAAVTWFAISAGADSDRLEAIRLAASEAVTNAVVHAYGRGGGTVRVSASYAPDELWLQVEDDGVGLRNSASQGGLGVGLVLIAQLADTFEIVRRSSGGTQLQMRFKLRVGNGATDTRPRRATGEALSLA